MPWRHASTSRTYTFRRRSSATKKPEARNGDFSRHGFAMFSRLTGIGEAIIYDCRGNLCTSP